MVAEEAHLPLVSDKVYEAAPTRFDGKVRAPASARAKHTYLLAGMVRCCCGHQPLSMSGRTRKDHRYYACGYVQNYGETAALEAHGGQKWVYVREEWFERLVIRFFEQRIFGPMRLDKLAKQLRAHDREQRRNGKLAGTRIRTQITELDPKIKAQVTALERGIEPDLVSERIAELRGEKRALEDGRAELGAGAQEREDEELSAQLARIPDLAEALRRGPRGSQASGIRVIRPADRLRQGSAARRIDGNRVPGRSALGLPHHPAQRDRDLQPVRAGDRTRMSGPAL